MSAPPLVRALGRRACAAALLCTAAVILAGCAGSTIADNMPTAVGGLPADAPKRAKPAAFPAAYDSPQPRDETPLTAAEQKQLEEDLIAASKRGSGASAATGSTRKP